MEDLITVEEIDEPLEDMEPLVIIGMHPDGSLGFHAVLSSPVHLLKVLRAIENKVLEDCFG